MTPGEWVGLAGFFWTCFATIFAAVAYLRPNDDRVRKFAVIAALLSGGGAAACFAFAVYYVLSERTHETLAVLVSNAQTSS